MKRAIAVLVLASALSGCVTIMHHKREVGDAYMAGLAHGLMEGQVLTAETKEQLGDCVSRLQRSVPYKLQALR